ncbi:ABC transporter ATP-binding protein [Mycobacterium sp. MS1601]|uniref:ABC transporter ATP-binding protein n=1 Tax=Mycobacterium sp. MS1601 TaxID=1936029 RepID=UPI00097969CD|nr:ABC transporter ATP-binding protein [Mycobacterium sp. MS1601]AQA03084.1 ABC transporter ATP-binding protein [Mycobacterium sp. MS1601]
MSAAHLEARAVSVRLGGRLVVDGVSVIAEPGAVVGIVGPNGCGKSTLLRALVRVLAPAAGQVLLDGVDIAALSSREFARSVAVVFQDTAGDFDLRANDVVAMGRAPFKRMFQRDDATDDRLVEQALELVGALHLRWQPFALMSGGERQRVLIARALAQQPRLLVLDEPTNHLDIRHQFDALALPRRLGVTAVVALHDLNLAAHYCDVIHVLRHGQVVAAGTPAEVLRTELLAQVYGVTATVGANPATGRRHVSFDPDR